MDFNDYIDSIILIVSGVLVALYGSGRKFQTLGSHEALGKGKMRVVFIIGLLIAAAGTMVLVWRLVQ